MIYLIVAILVMTILCAVLVLSLKTQSEKIKEAQAAMATAEAKEAAVRKNIEQVLDYEKQDEILVKQREEHVNILVKTRSKEKANEEIKTLMSNLRDAYNSL